MAIALVIFSIMPLGYALVGAGVGTIVAYVLAKALIWGGGGV